MISFLWLRLQENREEQTENGQRSCLQIIDLDITPLLTDARNIMSNTISEQIEFSKGFYKKLFLWFHFFLNLAFLAFCYYVLIWFCDCCKNGLNYNNTVSVLLDKSEYLCNDTNPLIYFYALINQFCCFCSKNCDQLSLSCRSVRSLQSKRQLESEMLIAMCRFNLKQHE